MSAYKIIINSRLKVSALLAVLFVLSVSCADNTPIVVQNLKMEIESGQQIFSEELLTGEIADTKIEHIAYKGPVSQSLSLSGENVNMFLFIKGNGILRFNTIVAINLLLLWIASFKK